MVGRIEAFQLVGRFDFCFVLEREAMLPRDEQKIGVLGGRHVDVTPLRLCRAALCHRSLYIQILSRRQQTSWLPDYDNLRVRRLPLHHLSRSR